MHQAARNGILTASSGGSPLTEKTALLRKLHAGPRILVLPNAWDVASARIFETAGFPAIGTTSAGVANSLGYADVQKIGRDEMLAVIERIVKSVAAPVTGDVEAGYDDPLATALALEKMGAAGMNLEDSLGETGALAEITPFVRTIERIRARTDLVINARSDVYLMGVGDPATRFERIVERLNAYRKAGADSLFAPGVRDAETIGKLAKAVDGPLNILATVGTPPIAELERLGVARVSIGSGAMRASMGLTQRIAKELSEHGTYSSFTDGAIQYTDANRLFEK
jgi:2-methylisocitrate lyase-like PEP mutase family enzyme